MRAPALAVAATVLLAMSSAAALTPAAGSATPHGCSTTKAVAFSSDGRARSRSAPLSCVGYTGYGGDESHIRIAPNGMVVQEPALVPLGLPSYMQAGLAVSRDRGGRWQLLTPNGATFQPNDNAIYIDHKSGRLYLVLTVGFGVSLAGETQLLTAPLTKRGYGAWSTTTMHGFVGAENSRFTSAPAPRGRQRAAGGHDVGYWCGNQNPAGTAPPILARTCFLTLDGGATWQRRGLVFLTFVPQHSECGTSSENFSAGDGNYPQGAPDGSLWLMVECGGVTYLARSTDEAGTFPVVHRPNGNAPVVIPFTAKPSGSGAAGAALGAQHELRVDRQGNLYAFEVDGSALLLRVSRNHGLGWSKPINLTAPAARRTSIYQWQAAVGAPGQVAVSYLAARPAGGWDGYVSLTHDGLARSPVVYAANVNPSTAPMASVGGVGDDFIDVDVAPDGSAWAAFWADCPTSTYEMFCAKSRQSPVPEHLQANEQTGPQAEVVARLNFR